MSARERAVPAFLALSCVGFVTAAPAQAAAAAAATSAAEDQQLSERDLITVTAQEAKDVESPKSVAPLLDTPQTITVISDQVLRKQNLLTLRDALATIPGITFGAGEGGGGYGDSINLRGYSANNDITQDGVRDSAQYSRTDPFNLQQIEVYNGANSVFNGAGSVGGTINLVTKTPQADTLTIAQGGIGTDDYYRGTVDSNVRLSDLVAVRLNAMIHRNDVPGRDVERFRRWGVAPSIAIGVDGPTRLIVSYVHQEDDNIPIFGVPYFQNAVNDGPLDEVDDSDYFGIRNLDKQDTIFDQLTVRLEHDFGEGLSLRNLTRWQRVHQDTITSAPQGTYCLSTGRLPTGAACPAGSNRPGFYYPSGPRGLSRIQENQLLYNQIDLRHVAGSAEGVRNTLVIGMSATKEDYQLDTGQTLRNPGGALPNPVQPPILIADPDTTYTGPVNHVLTARSKGSAENIAVYAFDNLELSPMFELNGGIRWESARNDFKAIPLLSYPPGTTPLTPAQQALQRSDERLLSYRVGAVFKPVPEASLYVAYGNAKTPSSASVRAGCGVITVPGVDPCAVAPESARTYEIGAKADLFGRRLQLTAALFRNERSNFRVQSFDPVQPSLQVLDGRARVDGIALGASGNVNQQWTIFANYTYLNSKVVQGVSDFCLANPTTPTCVTAIAAGGRQGAVLVQTPKHSGSLFTSYQLPFGLQLGYGLTYQGSFALANSPSSLIDGRFPQSDDYLIHRAFLSYTITDGITAQLNVQNFTNERYFTGIRNNGWATPGDARSAVVSLFYSF